MVKYIREAKEIAALNREMTVRVKLDCYIDDKYFADIRENKIATELAEDWITDIPEWLNNIVIQDLKEDLEADGKTLLADDLVDIKFNDNCGELLNENIIELTGTFSSSEDITDMDIKRIEKYLGGKRGIIASELPNGQYANKDGEDIVEVILDESYDINVIIL